MSLVPTRELATKSSAAISADEISHINVITCKVEMPGFVLGGGSNIRIADNLRYTLKKVRN